MTKLEKLKAARDAAFDAFEVADAALDAARYAAGRYNILKEYLVGGR